jgi:hypothetical protein
VLGSTFEKLEEFGMNYFVKCAGEIDRRGRVAMFGRGVCRERWKELL